MPTLEALRRHLGLINIECVLKKGKKYYYLTLLVNNPLIKLDNNWMIVCADLVFKYFTESELINTDLEKQTMKFRLGTIFDMLQLEAD